MKYEKYKNKIKNENKNKINHEKGISCFINFFGNKKL